MDFHNTLLAAGLLPREVVANGRWYRCATADKPRKKNGAYMLRADGRRGYFKDYAADDEWVEWRDERPVTPLQRDQFARERARQAERDRARAARSYAAMRAYYAALAPLRDGHPYLERKGLSLAGCQRLRVDGEVLVWPLYRHGQLATLQRIWPDGTKKNYYGCSPRGASLLLERPGATLHCLAEGFSTGLAVFQAVPSAQVEICLSADNLVTVAAAARVRGLAVVCGDNDWATKERRGFNPGLDKGAAAAAALGCGFAYPQGIAGSDWADALLEWGEDGPRRLRMEIMRAARPVIR